MIIYLDIENTIIDCLPECNILEDNCNRICDFIHKNDVETVYLFTWGWKTASEINKSVVDMLFCILEVPYDRRGKTFTKEDSVVAAVMAGLIDKDDVEEALIPGMMVSRFNIDKKLAFLIHTREARETGKECVLIDDTIETDHYADKNAKTINPADL